MVSWGKGAGLLQLLTVAYSPADPPAKVGSFPLMGFCFLQGGKVVCSLLRPPLLSGLRGPTTGID